MSSSGNATVKWLVALAILMLLLWGVWKFEHPEPPPSTPTPVPRVSPVEAPPRPMPPVPLPVIPVVHKPTVTAVSVPKKVQPVSPVPRAPTTPLPPPVPVTAPPPPLVVPAPPPAIIQEWQGNDTAVTHVGQVVIHNDRQWVHFWSEHRPHEAAPEIDFDKNMVIGVFAGPRPADPFSIRVVDVREVSGTLQVSYRERLPPPGTFAVNVTVYPYYIKVIPKSALPVKFKPLEPENVQR